MANYNYNWDRVNLSYIFFPSDCYFALAGVQSGVLVDVDEKNDAQGKWLSLTTNNFLSLFDQFCQKFLLDPYCPNARLLMLTPTKGSDFLIKKYQDPNQNLKISNVLAYSVREGKIITPYGEITHEFHQIHPSLRVERCTHNCDHFDLVYSFYDKNTGKKYIEKRVLLAKTMDDVQMKWIHSIFSKISEYFHKTTLPPNLI